MSTRYLADKSALARMPLEPVRRRLAPLLAAGELATCAMVDLEILFSARNHQEHEKIRQRRGLAYQQVPLTPEVFSRAVEVQGLLAKSGRHRLSIPDLVIAAAAEGAGLIVLHYDRDYDQIASVTGQPVEWVVPRDSI